MRDLFHVPQTYFLSHSVGCLPVATSAYFHEEFLLPWQDKGGGAWPGWMDLLDRYREHIASLVNTHARNICPQTNISSSLTKIIHALPKTSARTTIVLSQDDFPTIGYVVKQAEKAGYTLKFINGDSTDPKLWADAIDEQTALVHITHAFSNTSRLGPVNEVCRLARAQGAMSVVDVAQSAGAVPIDVQAWACDFAIGTGVKFLCCGPGACFLYACDAMIERCEPLDVGWFSHEDPFEMDIHDFRLAHNAMRFFGGTPSPAPFVMANCALDQWHKIGLENAQANIQSALSVLVKSVPASFLISPRNINRGATLVVSPDDRDELAEHLNKHKIKYDQRREGFRFSVHGYTSEADIDQLVTIFERFF